MIGHDPNVRRVCYKISAIVARKIKAFTARFFRFSCRAPPRNFHAPIFRVRLSVPRTIRQYVQAADAREKRASQDTKPQNSQTARRGVVFRSAEISTRRFGVHAPRLRGVDPFALFIHALALWRYPLKDGRYRHKKSGELFSPLFDAV